MTTLQALILGLVQGISEFLPISSSGHLVIAQSLLNLKQPPVFFDILVHSATLIAVILFFYKKLVSLNLKTINNIIVASIPTAIIGIILNQYKQDIFSSPIVASLGLLITSLLLLSTRKIPPLKQKPISLKQALIIGLAQGIAIIPGISRSGSTIITALWLQIPQSQAFSFSFLIAIPAIIGAQALEALDTNLKLQTFTSIPNLVGFLAALITGIIALKILKKILAQKKLYYFCLYTFPVAIITFLLALSFSK